MYVCVSNVYKPWCQTLWAMIYEILMVKYTYIASTGAFRFYRIDKKVLVEVIEGSVVTTVHIPDSHTEIKCYN